MTGTPQRLADVAQLGALSSPAGWPPLSAIDIARDGADAHWVLPDDAGTLAARCSLWWTHVPPLADHRPGVIGHYAASTPAAGCALLDAVCAELAANGCSVAIGPMDGSTWRKYRFMTDAGTEPPFFLEPVNPPDWPRHWTDAGFESLAHYFSGLVGDLSRRDPRAEAALQRLTRTGVTLRTLDLARFDDELRGIYSVSTVSFRDNFLYTELPEEEFRAQYAQIRPAVRPELVLVAEHEQRTVGFAFSVPDVHEQTRDGRVRTVIVKTIAILPQRALYGGLGSVMVDRTHQTAQALGYERVIHALMHESNQSRNISDRTGHTMRRYTLYARPLRA